MAAPSVTARSTPAGTHLESSHATKIASVLDPDISFWEKSVKPPGIDGGDPVSQTTHFNTTWRTMAPRILKTLTPINVSDAAYDPQVFSQILAIVNVNTEWTVHLSNGDTIAVWAYLRSAEPNDLPQDESNVQPSLSIVIQPTNRDSSGAEQGPVYTIVSTA